MQQQHTLKTRVEQFRQNLMSNAENIRLLAIQQEEQDQLRRAENFVILNAIMVNKALTPPGYTPEQVMFFEPNEINLYKHFDDYGTYYGTITKYEQPFFEVIINTALVIFFFIL